MISSNERGGILVVALFVLAWLSVLTGAWLRLVFSERDAVRLDGDELLARTLADAGIERTLAWFADPGSFSDTYIAGPTTICGSTAIPGTIFRKRCLGADGLPSFRDGDNTPQFNGTLDSPAVLVQWSDAQSVFLTPAVVSSDTPQALPAARLDLRIFAPSSPDTVATVVSRASVQSSTAVVRAELAEGPWRGSTQAVFAGDLGPNTIPVRVHWGGVAINGAVDASGLLDRLPRRSTAAAVNGREYAAEPGSDRWATIIASGAIIGPASNGSGFAAPFDHLHQHTAAPSMGWWGYQALKAYAQRHGRYFTTRGTGLLYANDAGSGMSPTAVFAAHSGGERLVFIDTLDRMPPREDNLEALGATMDFVDVDAYVGAHLTITPGRGGSVVLDSPSAPDAPEGPPLALDVTITGAHYRGALIIVGVAAAEARTRIIGSLGVLRGVRDAGAFEVWYDSALARGYRHGFPPVVVKPSSRRSMVMDFP